MIKADETYQLGLEMFARLNNKWGQSLCLHGKAILKSKTGMVEEAFRLNSQAIEFTIQLKNPERLTILRDLQANLAIQLGLISEARLNLTEILNHTSAMGDQLRSEYYRARIAELVS